MSEGPREEACDEAMLGEGTSKLSTRDVEGSEGREVVVEEIERRSGAQGSDVIDSHRVTSFVPADEAHCTPLLDGLEEAQVWELLSVGDVQQVHGSEAGLEGSMEGAVEGQEIDVEVQTVARLQRRAVEAELLREEQQSQEVSWMGTLITRAFVPLLEQALARHPEMALVLATHHQWFLRAGYELLGRLLQIFGQVAEGVAMDAHLDEARVILDDLALLKLDTTWLERRYVIAEKVLRRVVVHLRVVEVQAKVDKAKAELKLWEGELGVFLAHLAELECDEALLTSYVD